MIRLPLVTNSEMRTMRRCPREHQIAYTKGMRPVDEAGPLRFGTLVHSMLETHWRKSVAAIGEVDPYDDERARAMLDGYAIRWADDAYEVLGVEVQFRATLANPETTGKSQTYDLGGKLDAIVRDGRGDVWIVEHKTTSEDATAGSDYWKRLRLDSQISTYMVGARALGYEPRGVLYDVLKKPGQEPLKATPEASRKYTKDGALYAAQRNRDETPAEYGARVRAAIAADPERYYQRGTVVRLAEEEREAAYDVWQTAIRIRDARRTGIAPRNPEACVRYGRTCGYFGVCSGETTLENPRFSKVDHVHQELSSEIEEAAE